MDDRKPQVFSKDGTPIAYDQVGRGPPVILVVGALCSRTLGPSVKLAPLLADRFTVFTYDRRGRGDSGEGSSPFAVEREVEDLAALVARAGGRACVFGHSSGAVLALEASARGVPIDKLALYEAPLVLDASRASGEIAWERIAAFVAQGNRGGAVRAFMRHVGVPGFAIALARWMPVWAKVTATAHTLPYDGALVRAYQRGEPLPPGAWSAVTVPALAIAGGRSPAWMREGSKALAATLPAGAYRELAGQTHDVGARILAPALEEFFSSPP